MIKSLKYIAVLTLLSGCAIASKDWPSLADPVDTALKKDEVSANPAPSSQPIEPITAEVMTLDAAVKRFDTLKSVLTDEWLAQHRAYEDLKSATGDEDMRVAWVGAQLTLSRVSSAIGAIEDLSMVAIEGGDDLKTAVKTLLNQERAKMKQARVVLKAFEDNVFNVQEGTP